jgi:hypothetical protein
VLRINALTVSLILVVLAMTVANQGCSPGAEVRPKKEEAAVVVKVVWHASEAEVRQAFVDAVKETGQKADIKAEVKTMRGFSMNRGGVCEIHAMRPARVDDDRTTTVGHEYLHCLWGSYHAEGELL